MPPRVSWSCGCRVTFLLTSQRSVRFSLTYPTRNVLVSTPGTPVCPGLMWPGDTSLLILKTVWKGRGVVSFSVPKRTRVMQMAVVDVIGDFRAGVTRSSWFRAMPASFSASPTVAA